MSRKKWNVVDFHRMKTTKKRPISPSRMASVNICLSKRLTYVMSVKRLELPESSNSAKKEINTKWMHSHHLHWSRFSRLHNLTPLCLWLHALLILPVRYLQTALTCRLDCLLLTSLLQPPPLLPSLAAPQSCSAHAASIESARSLVSSYLPSDCSHLDEAFSSLFPTTHYFLRFSISSSRNVHRLWNRVTSPSASVSCTVPVASSTASKAGVLFHIIFSRTHTRRTGSSPTSSSYC